MQKYIFIIVSLSVSCVITPEECGEQYEEINGQCYYRGDIDVIQAFIDNSFTTINVGLEELDENGNGKIDPLELKIQKWNNKGRLTSLWLYDRNLSGLIPSSIGDLSELDTLNLSYNHLNGEIPSSIGNLIKLNYLYWYWNQLNGLIPEDICHIYNNLSNFYISYNQLCPPYPQCISSTHIGKQDTSICY